MGLDQVLADLEGEGYACWPLVIPACALNAPHRRDRVWILAHSDDTGEQKRDITAKPDKQGQPGRGDFKENAADTSRKLFNRAGNIRPAGRREPANGGGLTTDTKGQQTGGVFDPWFSSNPAPGGDWEGKTGEWTTEPPVCGPDDGIPDRVARLKALGNSVVPQIPEMFGHAIMAAGATRL